MTVLEFPQLAERYAPRELRLKVLVRDGFKCRYCRTPITFESANIDHVRPWKHGGQTVEANLVSACQDCNRSKGNKAQAPLRLSKMGLSSQAPHEISNLMDALGPADPRHPAARALSPSTDGGVAPGGTYGEG